MTFEDVLETYTVVEADDIRYDYEGIRHTGFDAIDDDGELWGVFEDERGECTLAR